MHRVGIIGLGSIGQRMLEAFACHPDFEPALAWDPQSAPCNRAKKRCPSLTIAGNAEELFADPEIDLIYLACPPKTHREHALSAMAAGKAILCEKPLGVDVAQSRELVERVQTSGVPNAVNLNYGSARSGTELEKAIRNGSTGEVGWFEVRLHLPGWAVSRYAEAPWLARREQGGFVREVSTHYVYLCQRLFGPATLESAYLAYPDDGVHAETFADIRLKAGSTLVTITATTLGAGPETNIVNVWGSKTAYRIRDLHNLDRFENGSWVPAYEHAERPDLDTYLRQLDNIRAMLRGESHSMPDFACALQTQLLIEAIHAH